MQIRIVKQTDPDPGQKNPSWYPIHDFSEEDAAAIRRGEADRYTVEIIRTDNDGTVHVLGDSYNHVARAGIAGIYNAPWAIHCCATEIIKAAKDELTGAAGLSVGDHVVFPNRRPDGAGRLHEVLEIPKDGEGYGLGVVVIRQLDAVKGHGRRRLLVSHVSKEFGPRVPIEGRNQGGIGESFREREGGGLLVYRGDYADQVVMPPSALGGALWGCRSIDEFGDGAWVYGSDRGRAIRAHCREYPNEGLTW